MPVIKHKSQRVGVFIDVQNLYHSARHLYNARVNFREVMKSAVAGRQLVRAIAYVISTESGEEKSFFEALTKLGIETKEKELQVFFGGMKKADWDVGIAVDVLRLAPSLDAVVLCSGDGDFMPLIEQLQSMGKQVEVVTFSRSASAKVKEAAAKYRAAAAKAPPAKLLTSRKLTATAARASAIFKSSKGFSMVSKISILYSTAAKTDKGAKASAKLDNAIIFFININLY